MLFVCGVEGGVCVFWGGGDMAQAAAAAGLVVLACFAGGRGVCLLVLFVCGVECGGGAQGAAAAGLVVLAYFAGECAPQHHSSAAETQKEPAAAALMGCGAQANSGLQPRLTSLRGWPVVVWPLLGWAHITCWLGICHNHHVMCAEPNNGQTTTTCARE